VDGVALLHPLLRCLVLPGDGQIGVSFGTPGKSKEAFTEIRFSVLMQAHPITNVTLTFLL